MRSSLAVRSTSSGHDLPANLELSERTARAVWELNTLPVPTVALVHGDCFGGGMGIVAACDVVIAADSAMFAITETRWGMSVLVCARAESIASTQGLRLSEIQRTRTARRPRRRRLASQARKPRPASINA